MSGAKPDFDAIIVGAGFAGLYLLFRLRALGLRVTAIDSADDVGVHLVPQSLPGRPL